MEDPVCGNGVIEYDEQCDDNNRRDGDGCNAYCELEDFHREITKKKIRERISRVPTDLEPLKLPPILPETGQVERIVKQERVASPSW